MRYLVYAFLVVFAGCSYEFDPNSPTLGFGIDEQVLANQRKQMGPKKIAEWCAMTEPQRRAFLLKRLEFTNASGGYAGGRYVDTTVVLSSELGAERAEYRKITGC